MAWIQRAIVKGIDIRSEVSSVIAFVTAGGFVVLKVVDEARVNGIYKSRSKACAARIYT